MIRLNLKLIIRIYTRRIQFDAFVYSWYFTSYIYFMYFKQRLWPLGVSALHFSAISLGIKTDVSNFWLHLDFLYYIRISFITFGFPLLHSDFLYYIRISYHFDRFMSWNNVIHFILQNGETYPTTLLTNEKFSYYFRW